MEFAFQSFSEFLQMGRHGLYVWLAYGFFALSISGLILSLVLEGKALKKELKQEGLL